MMRSEIGVRHCDMCEKKRTLRRRNESHSRAERVNAKTEQSRVVKERKIKGRKDRKSVV